MKDKYLNSVILVVVATGTALVAFVGDASRGCRAAADRLHGISGRHHRHPGSPRHGVVGRTAQVPVQQFGQGVRTVTKGVLP